MTEDEIIRVTLEEYRSLWSYYHKLLGEWKNFIDWYFKVVTLPAGVLGYIAVKGPGSPEVPASILAPVLGLVAIVGGSLYIGYSKEVRNGRNYEAAMAGIRAFLRSKEPALESVFTIDERRAPRGRHRSGSIAFWRGFSMAIVNSGVGAGAIVGATASGWLWGSVGFVMLLTLHAALFRLFMRQ